VDSKDIEKLNNLSAHMRRVSKKVKLLNLLRSAKEEYESNNFDDCIKICEEALEQNPNNSAALRGLGCSMQALGKYDKAVEYYKKALDFSENKEIEYTLLGTVYYLEDKFEDALKYYNLAIDSNEDYDPAYEGKNQTMLEQHLQITDLQDSLIRGEFLH